MVGVSIYFAYSNVIDIITAGRFNNSAMAVIENEIEVTRNMKYEDIGIQGGSPPGKLSAQKTVTVDNSAYTVSTTVRNIDDAFDGTVGGTPGDLSPADYKLIEFIITCSDCGKFLPVKMTTTVAPRNLEGSTKNGSLFINVINANGQPVSGANVSVLNTSVTPTITINDTTGVNGQLQLVDIATSSLGYQITVSKTVYSDDKTYPIGPPENPNPLKPHASVAKQQLTQLTLSIDKVSNVNMQTRDQFCRPVGNIPFSQAGAKLIGTSPNVLKYSSAWTTDSSGNKTVSNLEWDTYDIKSTSPAYFISGLNLFSPLIVDPDTTYALNWVMASKSQNALLVTVRDGSNQPITGATVQLAKSGFSETILSGRRMMDQSDWSSLQYDAKSANIDTDTLPGTLTLTSVGGKYASASDEWLVSKTFDMGTADPAYYAISWTPASQPAQTVLKFQVASNNDNSTWDFIGPDGTSGSYFTASGTALPGGLGGKRYFRYKAFLRTDDQAVAPQLAAVDFEFSSSCAPSDQAFFNGLSAGTYTLTISKPGYQTITDANVSIAPDWLEYRATLVP